MSSATATEIWFAAGLRTPFAKVDGPLGTFDAVSLSVPVVRHMIETLRGATPDFAVWGTVVPNLTWSNIAREVLMDAGVAPTIPAFSTVMACSSSMIGAIEAAGMINGLDRNLALVGGVESMSRIQLGLGQALSDWIRKYQQARSLRQRLSHVTDLRLGDVVIPIGDLRRDTIPRTDTSFEKLAKLPPSFDHTSGHGTMTAGNSSPLTDGAASLWVASQAGVAKLPGNVYKARLVDWEITSIDLRTEGLLMAPAFAIPRLLARCGLTYADIDIWEIHEAFAAQVLAHIKALENPAFLKQKAGVDAAFGTFPRERMNPNGGSIALGHPFGATGARILSQTVKEL